MNTNAPLQAQMTNYLTKCNIALVLALLLPLAFMTVAQTSDISSTKTIKQIDDYCIEYSAESDNKDDSNDDSGTVSYDTTGLFDEVVSTCLLQVNTEGYSKYKYLRPLSRAPPEAFI